MNPLSAETAETAESIGDATHRENQGDCADSADSALRAEADGDEPAPDPGLNGSSPDPQAARATAEAFVAANPAWATRARRAVKGNRTELDDDSVDLRDHEAATLSSDDGWSDL